MNIEVKVPELPSGEKMGRIIKWHVKEGDFVKKGTSLCDIAAGKANVEVCAESDGIVDKIIVSTGDTVKAGDVISVISQVEKASNEPVPVHVLTANTGMKEYDVAVIGGGPGGYVAAIKAAKMGAKVALFEKDKLGGTCLNRGCIPTKAYARVAEVYDIIERAGEFGFDVAMNSFDYKKAVDRKNNIVKGLVEGINVLVKSNGIDLYAVEAKIEKDKSVVFAEGKVKAKNIIIATGSSPADLPIEGIKSKNVINSDDILDMTSLPESMCVIGGGVIGMEIAFIMHRFGVKVSVVEMMPNILPLLDKEVSDFIESEARKAGIKVYTSCKVERIMQEAGGGSIAVISENGEQRCIYADKIFVSIGRKLNTDIGPIAELLEFDGRAIKVDEHLRTNIDGVYAIGDVTNKMMLAHVASAQGEAAVENIFGGDAALDYMKIPAAVFTQPEIGYFGYTEEEARQKFGDIKIGKFYFAANGRAKTCGETKGFVKTIADKDNRIVGAWVIGGDASELSQIISVSCQCGVSASELKRAVYTHPTRSEAIMEAVKDIFKESIHQV